jgi:hypothetical protein
VREVKLYDQHGNLIEMDGRWCLCVFDEVEM